jgi:ribonuclease HII
MKIDPNVKYIIGIDEAGRGPLAGPVAVGVCLVGTQMSRKNFPGIRDSKKLTEKMREEWFSRMQELQKAGKLCFAATLISNKIIDKKGISFAIKKAMSVSLKKIKVTKKFKTSQTQVLLDGGLRAPEEFIFQKTIIKGDEKEFSISLASIAAKVIRDRYMKKVAKKYPLYDFGIHKGYGTAKHIATIKNQGISAIHRQSFLKNLLGTKIE